MLFSEMREFQSINGELAQAIGNGSLKSLIFPHFLFQLVYLILVNGEAPISQKSHKIAWCAIITPIVETGKSVVPGAGIEPAREQAPKGF